MIKQSDLSQQLAIDTKSMGSLQRAARDNSPEAVKAAATQFEAMFLNMVMKSMREASVGEGVFDSEQSRTYTSMLDQQFSQGMASRGIGLADVLARQLSPQRPPMELPGSGEASTTSPLTPASFNRTPPREAPALSAAIDRVAPSSEQPRRVRSKQPAHVQEFQTRLAHHAEQASQTTGIPAKFILAQAALESGWGKREIVAADGTRSHNLFGIKATKGWKGKVIEVPTTEYVNGVPQRKMQKFRAYDSYTDAFRDYAKLLSNNPRYQGVIAQGQDAVGFASQLQRAGYATDPNYAAKLTKIIQRNLA